MTAVVPSLEGSLFLKDTQSIIGYTLRKFFKTPKDAVPILPDMIISLPWLVAKYGKEPSVLVSNIQSDLQTVFNRIFNGSVDIAVITSHVSTSNPNEYDINIAISYMTSGGDITQSGTTLLLKDGQIVLPEDHISNNF